MIDREACFLYGRVRKATGFQGELIVSLLHDAPERMDAVRFFFLLIDGDLVPFMISEAVIQSARTLKVRFTDVPDLEKARRLTGCEVYLGEMDFRSVAGHRESIVELPGYTVSERNSCMLGTVREIISQPHQDLLVVASGDKEIYIPMVPEIILDIDHARKAIIVELPVGLTDLNA